MTRCTAEVAISLRLASDRHDARCAIYQFESDPLMCQALVRPQPTFMAPNVTSLFLELHDALIDVRYPLAGGLDETRDRVTSSRDAVASWFDEAIAGQARIELTPEALWALFQLANAVRDAVTWSERGCSNELPPDPDRDVTYADFDEPAYVRVVS